MRDFLACGLVREDGQFVFKHDRANPGMANYYLDIETTGLDPGNSSIITIQYQELERGTGRPVGELSILKEWELGERGMLSQLVYGTPITNMYKFDFIPIGYNLGFEHRFLLAKSRMHGLPAIDVLSHPCVDLHSVGIMMNRGEFKDSGLDKITGKRQSGMSVPNWYGTGRYAEIEEYIQDETREFVKWYRWLLAELPQARERWNQYLSGSSV